MPSCVHSSGFELTGVDNCTYYFELYQDRYSRRYKHIRLESWRYLKVGRIQFSEFCEVLRMECRYLEYGIELAHEQDHWKEHASERIVARKNLKISVFWAIKENISDSIEDHAIYLVRGGYIEASEKPLLNLYVNLARNFRRGKVGSRPLRRQHLSYVVPIMCVCNCAHVLFEDTLTSVRNIRSLHSILYVFCTCIRRGPLCSFQM